MRLLMNTSARRLLGLLAALLLCGAATVALAATNISATPSQHYAWNDLLGWFNFHSSNTVTVTASGVTGLVDTTAGPLSLDCSTAVGGGSVCGTSDYHVVNAAGALSGYGWMDAYGWVSFSCVNHGCGGSSYGVAINPATGIFSGYAWNDILGWISFNCVNTNGCGTSDYKVVTSWSATSTSGFLDATILDSGVPGGAQVNGITWTGDEPAGTDVRLQVATANATSGPWTYAGPDGTGATFYNPASGVAAPLYPWAHPPARYFRYRVILVSDETGSVTPRVDDVVLRWSP